MQTIQAIDRELQSFHTPLISRLRLSHTYFWLSIHPHILLQSEDQTERDANSFDVPTSSLSLHYAGEEVRVKNETLL